VAVGRASGVIRLILYGVIIYSLEFQKKYDTANLGPNVYKINYDTAQALAGLSKINYDTGQPGRAVQKKL